MNAPAFCDAETYRLADGCALQFGYLYVQSTVQTKPRQKLKKSNGSVHYLTDSGLLMHKSSPVDPNSLR